MRHHKYRWLFWLTACFSIFIYSSAFAQSKGYQQRLKSLANEYGQRFTAEKREAVRVARELGIPIRKEFKDGRVTELMRFERGVPVYYITYNSTGAEVVNSDKVWPDNGGTGLSLTGGGQTLGVWDGGATRSSHRELIGRVTQKDGAVTLSNHATHVAGTMAAGGISSKAKGMSFQTGLHAYDWNNAEAEMILAAAEGLLVSNHSYGHITGWAYGSWSGNTGMHWFGDITVSGIEDYWFGFYSNYSRQWDEISYNAPNYLIVRAAGNDRHENHTGEHYFRSSLFRRWTLSTDYRKPDGGLDGYDSIPSGGVAKNILTVGAVGSNGSMPSFSGWGPTDDGRVKPDIVAKGISVYSPIASGDSSYGLYSGTSMASPMVTGSIGLLLQHQENLHGYNTSPLWSSTVKALIIHGADDSVSNSPPGPDYRVGWGLMNTKRSAEIMTLNADANEDRHIHEVTLMENNEISIPVIASGDEPLRATIVWTDIPGTPPPPSLNPNNIMLVNDLDLRIEDESSTLFLPYVLDPANPAAPAATGDNFRDNVEMVHIASPNPDETYTITISHKKDLIGGSQDFSLIITGITAAGKRIYDLPEAPGWTLSVENPQGSGTTDPEPGDHHYDAGINAAVTAIPVAGWKLAAWLLDGEDAGNTNPIMVESSQDGGISTLQAVMAPSFQKKIDLAIAQGDNFVVIEPGEYTTSSPIVIGEGADGFILTSKNGWKETYINAQCGEAAIIVKADNVTIEGFWLSNFREAGIVIEGNGANVFDNRIDAYCDGSEEPGGDAIVIDGAKNTLVEANSIVDAHVGILVRGMSEETTIRENTIVFSTLAAISNAENGGALPANTTAFHNELYDNQWGAVWSANREEQRLAAAHNWWGHGTGPAHEEKNPYGEGDKVSENVDFFPWLNTQEIENLEVSDPLSRENKSSSGGGCFINSLNLGR